METSRLSTPVHGYATLLTSAYMCVCVCAHISRRKIKLRFHGITALEFNFYPGLKQRYLLPRNSNWLAISSRSNFHYSRQIVSVDIGENRFSDIAREIRNGFRKFSTSLSNNCNCERWNIISFVRIRDYLSNFWANLFRIREAWTRLID